MSRPIAFRPPFLFRSADRLELCMPVMPEISCYTMRRNDRFFGDTHVVMPAKAGIHDLAL
jgi:hypothetical protein